MKSIVPFQVTILSPNQIKSHKRLEISLLWFALGCFLYMLSPWRIWGHFLFAGYTEIIFHSILLLSLALICFFSIKLFIDKKTEVKLNVPDILFSIIFIILFLTAIFSPVNPEIITSWISCVLLYILIRSVKRKYHIYLLYVFPVAAFFQLLYGIKIQTDFFLPGKGLELVCGTFSNTAIWAQFLSVSILIACGVLIFRRSARSYLFGGALVLLLSPLLIIADSRAAWLSTSAGLFFMLWHKYYRLVNKIRRKKIVFISLTLVIIAFSCTTFRYLYQYKTDSAKGRLLIWQVTGKMIQDKPIFGFGTDGFRKNYMMYQGEYFKANNRPNYKMLANNNPFAFNEFLKIGVEYGIIGLCLSVIFLLSLFRKTDFIISGRNKLSITIARSCIISFIVFSFFSYPLSVWQLSIVFISFSALAASAYAPRTHFRKLKLIPIFLITVILLLFYTFLFPYSKAFRQWNEVLVADIPSDSTLHVLNKVRPLLEQHPSFLLNYGIRLNRAGKYEEAISILSESCKYYPTYLGYIELGKSFEKIGNYSKAEKKWTLASWMVPHKFTPLYLQMQMNFSIGELQKAYILTDSILDKEIKLYSPALNKILREAKQIKAIKP